MSKHRLMLSAATAALFLSPVGALADNDITGTVKSEQDTTTQGNIYVESGGLITIKAATPVILYNSNNVVIINSGGGISNIDTSNAYGVLIDTTAANIISTSGTGFQSLGTIDLSGKNSSKYGVALQGANAFLGNIQLLSTLTTDTSGNTAVTGSSVNVVGDDSTAIYLARGATLDGELELGGSITQQASDKDSDRDQTRLVGIDSVVNGMVLVDSNASLINVGPLARGITVLSAIHPGCAADAAALYTANGLTCNSAATGALVVSGSLTTTGTLNPTTKSANDEGGAALVVGASIDGGIEINGSATGINATYSGSISGNGVSEPVILFDPTQPSLTGFYGVTAPITLGAITTATDTVDGTATNAGSTSGPTACATVANCYSFINRGTVVARPIDAEFSTTAMAILGQSSTNYITFMGGILNTGTLSAQATTNVITHNAGANIAATAIYIGSNVNIPYIDVLGETVSGTSTTAGSINAQVSGSGGGTATAILLGDGANVPQIDVKLHGTILASVTTTTTAPDTDEANATTPFALLSEAIVDLSGNLHMINNAGQILAANSLLNPAVGTSVSTVARAIDLLQAPGTGGATVNSTGTILGDVVFGAASDNDHFSVGNAVAAATGGNATVNTYATVAETIVAQPVGLPPITDANVINFGSGTGDTLDVSAYGYVNSVIKASSPGAVAITLGNSGILAIANSAADGTVNASTFDISGGTLIMPIAQNSTPNAVPVVTATEAKLDPNTTLGLQFTSFFSAGFTAASVANPGLQKIVLVRAPTTDNHISQTTVDTENSSLQNIIPFLFESPTEPGSVAPQPLSLVPNAANTDLVLSLLPRSPGAKNADGTAGLGLTGDAYNLFPLASASLVSDPLLGAAIANGLTVRNGSGAINVAASQQQAQQVFSQFAPDVSGGARQVAIMITDQATGPVAARQRLLRSYGNQPGEMTIWSDEYFGSINNKGRYDADGTLTNYKDHGFGFSVGVDAGTPRGGWYGAAFTFYTGDVSQDLPRTTKTDTEWYLLTGYSDWHGRHVFLDTKIDVGYGNFNGQRAMTVADQSRDAIGKRAGLVGSLGATTGVDLHYGGVLVTPHVSLDGMTLREEGYYETGGEALDLQVAPYYANSFRVSPGIDIKGNIPLWGAIFSPEARIGYRYDFVDDPVKLKAGFISTGGLATAGNSFTFTGPDPDTGNVLAGMSLGFATDTWQLGVNYDWLRGNNGSTTQIGTLTLLARI